ncbi:MAG: hypothetical protein EBY28_24400 [Betaproteobacteria bacterium]|nr:hypothetical protein [Betaproteobacteria bacterium]
MTGIPLVQVSTMVALTNHSITCRQRWRRRSTRIRTFGISRHRIDATKDLDDSFGRLEFVVKNMWTKIPYLSIM